MLISLHLRHKVNMSDYTKSSKGNKVSRKNSALKTVKFCLMYIYIFSLQDRHCLKISLQKKMLLRPYLHKRHSAYFCKCQTTGTYCVGILFEGAFCFPAPLCLKDFDWTLNFSDSDVSQFQNVLLLSSNFPKN